MAQRDFDRFLDLLTKNFDHLGDRVDGIERKLDRNTQLTIDVKAQAEKTNGRVTALENKTYKKTSRFNFTTDKQLLTLFGFAVLVFLLILAAVLGVKVPSLP